MWKWLKRLFERWRTVPEDPVKNDDPDWLKVAYKEIGTKEIPGDKHEKRILDYGTAVDLDVTSDEIPWCSNLVNWCFKQVDIEGTKSAVARSWLAWGKEIEKPYRGCVAIFRRGKSSWQGHVGFWVGEQGSDILLLGGNQSNQVCIMRYPKSKLLGFRTPGADVEH